MTTSVIGYPRIGAARELKFACEKYFKQQITSQDLAATAAALRKTHWQTQTAAGIDLIPVNDFSLYDNTLDTAVLLNAVPQRYRDLHLSPLDTYFAQARGYQGDHGDVTALPMKKWFNTNYHYIVPEIEDGTQIKLAGDKPFAEFAEARQAGVARPKPVIEGPLTFLKLCRLTGGVRLQDVTGDVITAYREILSRFRTLQAEWVQLDEPYLVHDLSAADIELFRNLYAGILTAKGPLKILLQTYFGDVRDVYGELVRLNVEGLGLDFIEGRMTETLIREQGFPQDKLLFAGIVNGKNIWRNCYDRSLKMLRDCQNLQIRTVISTSCSLLHVPYTLACETQLAEDCRQHFAFAQEKLTELTELDAIIAAGPTADVPQLQQNRALFTRDRRATDPQVAARVAGITAQDCQRHPDFAVREQLQHDAFKLPLFPTTTIGSFPQTAAVKQQRKALRTSSITADEYNAFMRQQIAACVRLQEKLGLDVLVHGEFERNDMVEYFGQHLKGYLFTQQGWVQSYGTRCVKPPVVWGDISRERPITVDWSVYAQSLTTKPLKGMLTGPVTILNWSFPREDIPLKTCTLQLALALRDEVLDLERHGIKIIQIDEAALREKLPLRQSDWYGEYLDWAIPAFRLVHSGVQPTTQIHTHMCYSEFTDIIPAIDSMDADVISFEASRSDLAILDALKANHFKTEVGPGVYDIHSPRIPSTAEIKQVLQRILTKVTPAKLWVNPDCGLKTRGEAETEPSLAHLVAAAKELRHEH